ncbi:hypothetical protein QAD02_020601 [Eretmocerus hayati]|uniref:Uncharacterized protein n=1 Tax=Eretmocerus hayati TaxID=131215 RepID=A0ACC2PP48_9HYME|nr:hypothetical protein QAD02_020601 [Eretmocerus hayati]
MGVSAKVREYFSKNFTVAVQLSKGDVLRVQAALKAVVPYAYGDHSIYGDWCKAKNSEHEYIHRNLPHGKCLSDGNSNRLAEIFDGFASNSEKIAPCGSTQMNESMNHVFASKNPKSRHYAGSQSLSFRAAAAVCQKNIGCKYAMQVFEEAGFASGIATERFRKRKDEIREKKAKNEKSISAKKRRYELKKQRSSNDSSQNRREGITYESGVSFHDVSDLMPNPSPKFAHLQAHPELKIFKRVVIDVETTGMSVNHDQIFEIANSSFVVYILPSKAISEGASEATGFRMSRGELYHKEEKIATKSAEAAVLDLIHYLKAFGCPVILIAHNGLRFDVPLIIKLLVSVGLLKDFTDIVAGFVDCWMIFKQLLPERKKTKKSFSVPALVTEYLPEVDIASLHRASNDVAVLQSLLDKIGVTDETILKNNKSIRRIFEERKEQVLNAKNKESLVDFKNHLSSHTINKMSKNGINKQVLQSAFGKGGHDALRALLGQNVNGKPLVTTNKNILEKVFLMFPTKTG